MYKRLLLVSSLLLSLNSYAFMDSCVKDIFKVGLGFDSGVYDIERDEEDVTLSSESGISSRINWIIFCPQSGIEISPYIYSRNYSFDNSGELSGAPDEIDSFTIGVEFSKEMMVFGKRISAILDIGSREDFSIYRDYHNDEVHKQSVDNTMLMVGLKSNIYSSSRTFVSLSAKMGMLFSEEGDIDDGFTSRLSSEVLYKLSKKYSLMFDFFYDYYDQRSDQADAEISRKELGVTTYFMFRL